MTTAHCRLGKVRRLKKDHRKRVKLVILSQGARKGASLPNASKVSVSLGPAPSKRRHY
jgi:hypothetical protein